MKVRITATTDNQHLGFTFDHRVKVITFSNGVEVAVEKRLLMPSGYKFINSNYIIDTIKV